MEENDLNINGLMEFFNDGLFTSILLKIYEKMPTSYGKDYLGYFLLNTSSIYIHDLIQSKILGEIKLTKNNKDYLSDLRVNSLKLIGNTNSKHIIRKMDEMGIDFKNEINDCIITCNTNGTYDINFRCWYPHNSVDFKKFSYDLINNCDLLLNGLLKYEQVNIYEIIINNLSDLISECANKIHLDNFKLYSYSSKILFKNSSISDEKKILILQYYGFIKSIIYFDSILNNEVITIKYGNHNFNSDYYFIKLKALFIDSFYDALPLKSTMRDDVEFYCDKIIPNDFWKKNRKIRKNIHYKDFEIISEDEYTYVKEYQKQYLDKIINIMEQQMNIVIDHQVKFNTLVSKLVGRFRTIIKK